MTATLAPVDQLVPANLATMVTVLRGGFEADGLVRERGEVLSSTGWRNVEALVNTRYLARPNYDLLDHIVECDCGRRWVDTNSAETHKCPARKRED